jgi:hypothetical protein
MWHNYIRALAGTVEGAALPYTYQRHSYISHAKIRIHAPSDMEKRIERQCQQALRIRSDDPCEHGRPIPDHKQRIWHSCRICRLTSSGFGSDLNENM